MPSVTIDAGVLATPPESCSVDDAHRYVESLLEWSKLLDEPWVAIYMSERAPESLIADELFPFREQLKLLFAANGITEYAVNDVAQVLDRLLQSTPSFETYFSMRDVLHDDLSVEPDILKLCSGAHLQVDLARCVVLIAILRKHCQEPVNDHSLILRRAPDRIVRVRALIHTLEHGRADIERVPEPSEYFEGDILVCDNLRGLIECLDESAILQQSSDAVGVNTAIQIAIYKFQRENGVDAEWARIPHLRIGDGFWHSFQRLLPTQQLANRILRATVETLVQTNMSATHALRTGSGGNDPQRVRQSDQAKACRRDVDREHHLHYWQSDTGTVEIASVSFPHDDFTIPEW